MSAGNVYNAKRWTWDVPSFQYFDSERQNCIIHQSMHGMLWWYIMELQLTRMSSLFLFLHFCWIWTIPGGHMSPKEFKPHKRRVPWGLNLGLTLGSGTTLPPKPMLISVPDINLKRRFIVFPRDYTYTIWPWLYNQMTMCCTSITCALVVCLLVLGCLLAILFEQIFGCLVGKKFFVILRTRSPKLNGIT